MSYLPDQTPTPRHRRSDRYQSGKENSAESMQPSQDQPGGNYYTNGAAAQSSSFGYTTYPDTKSAGGYYSGTQAGGSRPTVPGPYQYNPYRIHEVPMQATSAAEPASANGTYTDTVFVADPPARKSAFTRLQRTVLTMAALFLAAAVICLGAGILKQVAANTELRKVQSRLRSQADAYQARVDNHLYRLQSSGYESIIREAAAARGLRPELLFAVIKNESDYVTTAVSSAGARGLMQIMPANVEWFSHKVGLDGCTVDDLFDPKINIRLGCWYLYYLGEMFDYDPVLMICSYHAGQGNVKSWLEKYSSDGVHLSIDEIPMADTKTYVKRVMNSYAIYTQNAY